MKKSEGACAPSALPPKIMPMLMQYTKHSDRDEALQCMYMI